MSYHGGFSRLHFGDGGSQGMAKGEDSVGSCEGEGSPSTSFEDVPLRPMPTGRGESFYSLTKGGRSSPHCTGRGASSSFLTSRRDKNC